jgi:PBP1b-binding outer membrane lipoprotein LpoB
MEVIMTKYLCIIAVSMLLAGCGQPTATNTETQKKKPSATSQAVDRMSGKTAVKSYKHTKDILGDVTTTRDARHQELQKFKQD